MKEYPAHTFQGHSQTMPRTSYPSKPTARVSQWARVKELLAEWFLDNDLDTQEKLLITASIVLSVAVLVLNARLIAVPPPYIQGWVLTLPAPLWFFLLLSISVVYIWARCQLDFVTRKNCALASGLVFFALCGPLQTKAPTLLLLVVPVAISFFIVALRLRKLIRAENQGDLNADK